MDLTPASLRAISNYGYSSDSSSIVSASAIEAVLRGTVDIAVQIANHRRTPTARPFQVPGSLLTQNGNANSRIQSVAALVGYDFLGVPTQDLRHTLSRGRYHNRRVGHLWLKKPSLSK